MKQDDILREKFGRENHFRVPEGYFDDFADRMMEMIPEAAEAPAVKSRRVMRCIGMSSAMIRLVFLHAISYIVGTINICFFALLP